MPIHPTPTANMLISTLQHWEENPAIDERVAYLEACLTQTTARHHQLLAQLEELNAKNHQLHAQMRELNRNVESNKDEQRALKRTISEAAMNSNSVYNKSKSISSQLESLSVECDSLRLEVEKSRKLIEGYRFSGRDHTVHIAGE